MSDDDCSNISLDLLVKVTIPTVRNLKAAHSPTEWTGEVRTLAIRDGNIGALFREIATVANRNGG